MIFVMDLMVRSVDWLTYDAMKDVLDVDDAARVTRDLLFRRHFTAKKAVRMCLIDKSFLVLG